MLAFREYFIFTTLNEGEFTDDFRGCSPFEETRAQYCAETQFEGIDHLNCRDTCDTNNCNTEKIQKHSQCYSCQAIRDSQGNAIGVGNDDCFDNLHSGLLMDCNADEDFCIDEILVDWLVKGEQIVQLRRGCSKTQAPGPCTSGETSNIKYKDCLLSCNGDGCNNNMNVGDKFIGSYQETECYSCRYVEKDDGEVNGNQFCPDGAPELITPCPNYANAACYTGASAHNFEGKRVDEVYKGCSSFEILGNGEEEYNQTIGTDEISYAITKTTCRGAKCNPVHKPPLDPEEAPEPDGNQCQVCQVTVDQYNRTIGVGQDACWDGNDQYWQPCPQNSWCQTELEIDWYAKGHFSYRMYRGCSSIEAPENCYTGGSTLIQYKDCSVSCDPEEDGAGCNDGIAAVAEKYSTQTVSSCYQCEYIQDPDGTVHGLPGCGEDRVLEIFIPADLLNIPNINIS